MGNQPWKRKTTGSFGSKTRLACPKPEAIEAGDAVAFAREKLGFNPDEKQMAMLRGGKRGILNCSRQWGKSRVAAGQGGASGLLGSGESDTAVDAERAAERGVSAKGGGVRAAIGNQSSRGWGQRDIDRVSEWLEDCGAAGE